LSVKGINTHEQFKLNHRTNNDEKIERRCTKCLEWKEENIDNFYMKNKKTPELGFTPACRSCTKTKSNKYREEHWQEHSDSFKQWRADHLDYMIDYNKQWRIDHSYHVKIYIDIYRKDNPDKVKQYTLNHRQHDITESEWRSCLKVFNNTCAYCGISIEQHIVKRKGKYIIMQFHKEHVDDEGYNDLRNAVPSCRDCNSHKHQYNMEEWFRCQEFFDEERLSFIKWWLTEGYKEYIEYKPPYRIIKKKNEDNNKFHHELWSVDEYRNTVECLAIADKKKDLIKDVQIYFKL